MQMRFLVAFAALSCSAALLGGGKGSAADSTKRGAVVGCAVTGFKQVYRASTPAYRPGDIQRDSALGASLQFPLKVQSFDAEQQRFRVASAKGAAIDLRRSHVEFHGPKCPGQTRLGESIVCYEGLDYASRGSNAVRCEVTRKKDAN